jgi:integrase
MVFLEKEHQMTVQKYLVVMQGKWAEATFVRYRDVLIKFETEVDLENLTALTLRAWLYGQGWGQSQRYLAWVAVRGYIRWRFGERHPAMELREKRVKAAPQRALKIPQIKRLISSFNTMTTKGIRDLAICTLMLDTGLRCSEVCRLDLRFLDMEERQLKVLIKGGRWGTAMFSEPTGRFMADWLAIRPKRNDAVFISLNGKKKGQRITREGLFSVIQKWGTVAGIGKLSPHDLRRSFAVTATRLGAPSRLVQIAGRWSSIEMVEVYTQTLDNSDFKGYFPVEELGF